MGDVRIVNGRVVTPSEVVERGAVVIRDGRIEAVEDGPVRTRKSSDIDAAGGYVFPGFVDSHSDMIENEVSPRPNARLPFELAFLELEKKLLHQGITTMYHAISLSGRAAEPGLGGPGAGPRLIESVASAALGPNRRIDHRVHLRFEMHHTEAGPFVYKALQERKVHAVSFMDHSPGQGQFHDVEGYRRYLVGHRKMREEDVERYLEMWRTLPRTDFRLLDTLAETAYRAGIPLASHDDDTVERLNALQTWRGAISEFPVGLEVALTAKQRGLHVVLGAPNVLLGRSTGGNLSAVEAIAAGAVDSLCSDYYPGSMLHAVFRLHRLGYPLPFCVNLVSKNPADVLGIGGEKGALRPGKDADAILVHLVDGVPSVTHTFVRGRLMAHTAHSAMPSPEISYF